MKTTFKGRSVEIGDVTHRSDVVDSFVETAYYEDTGKELTDAELDELTDQLQKDGSMHELYLDWQIDRADALSDYDR